MKPLFNCEEMRVLLALHGGRDMTLASVSQATGLSLDAAQEVLAGLGTRGWIKTGMERVSGPRRQTYRPSGKRYPKVQRPVFATMRDARPLTDGERLYLTKRFAGSREGNYILSIVWAEGSWGFYRPTEPGRGIFWVEEPGGRHFSQRIRPSGTFWSQLAARLFPRTVPSA
jgi:hypothetical protein